MFVYVNIIGENNGARSFILYCIKLYCKRSILYKNVSNVKISMRFESFVPSVNNLFGCTGYKLSY